MSDSDTTDDKSSLASSSSSPPPSVASSPEPSTPKTSDKKAFKSSLQVLLQKQDGELVKNIIFRKKLEEEEGTEDEVLKDEGSRGKQEANVKDEGTDDDDDDDGGTKDADTVSKVKKLRKKSVDKNANGEGEEGDKKKEKEQRRRKHRKSGEKEEEEENTTNGKTKARKKKSDVDKRENVAQADRENTKVPKKMETAVKTRKKSNTNQVEEDTKHSEREKENETTPPKKENETTSPKKENETTSPKKENETTSPKKENDDAPQKVKKTIKAAREESSPKTIRTPEKEKTETKPKKMIEEREETVIQKSEVKTSKETNAKDESNKMKEKRDKSEERLEQKTGKRTDNRKDEKDNSKQDVPPASTDKSSLSSPTSSSSHKGKLKEKNKKKEISETDYERSMRNQQGILMKKGQTPFSSWKKYYFVLDGKLLMYYHSESDYRGLLGAKGSLDLSSLGNVEVKKAGRTKSHFPFSLSRRNQKTINLATPTEEERELWVNALRSVHQNRNNFSGSENVLHASPTAVPGEKKEKYATMPVGTPPANCRSEDLSSESEEENPKEVKKPKEEEAEPKEEEPVLITPKKVMRVGIGIPLDLGAVKLKKVNTPKKEAEMGEPKPSDEEDKDKDENGAEKFGVKLKKASVTENAHQQELENKLAGKKVVVKEPAEVAVKRSCKQPVIPLNKSPLLSHAELDLSRVSPESKRSMTTERKKSPSPSIPLSRGVQAVLVKSGEEPDDADGGKTKELSVNIAKSKEIRFSEDVMSIQDEPSIEYVPVKNETDNRHGKDKEESVEVFSNEERKDAVEIPQVSVMVKEKSDEDRDNEETDEEFLRIVEQNKQSGLLSNSSDKTPRKDDSSVHKPVGKEQEKDQNSERNLKNDAASPVSTPKSDKISSAEVQSTPGKDIITTPISPTRLMSGTNESSTSSCKSDSETAEKKVRRLNKSNSKDSTSGDDEKQEETNKESKTKRKKKSSFSKLLPSKKNKEKKGKCGSEDSLPPDNKTSKSDDSPKSSKVKPIKPEETIRADSPVVTEQVETTEKNIPHISVQGDQAEKDTTPVVELRHNPLISRDEGRCSTYSRSSNTSREMDPPPLVPEKRGIRAKSPSYDIPQSNRPITSGGHEDPMPETEPKEGEKVDGMISQEQINAILSARDSLEKRKMSIARNSGGLLVVPDSSQVMLSKYEIPEDMSSRRPSYYSITSTESDEPLPRTHFLSGDRHSNGSGSFKIQPKSDDSDISDCPSKSPECSSDLETTVVLRRQPRLTDTLTAGKRVSLTSPEFTVLEEDRQDTSDTRKNSLVKEMSSAQIEVRKTSFLEKDEQNDYFPVIGGGFEVRQPSPSIPCQDSSAAGMRTSGILGLKAFLEENQEDLGIAKAGISRLGHSAAIEKLKRESGEDT